MFKIGETVEIVDNIVCHRFKMGQHVIITQLDIYGNPDYAESLDGSNSWFICIHDVKKVEVE